MLNIKPASECAFDEVSLGEVMLRLDPGERRIRTARHFDVWEGGGEYNVARGLRRAFGLRTGVVTALADNEVGRLIEDFMLQGGVDTSWVQWMDYDGVGRSVRNGLNFTERGFGVRGAIGVSDRGNTAVSQLRVGEIDWDRLFGELGVRWFHSGGIFAALSPSSAEVLEEALTSARRHGTITSFDLNYRPSLWASIGGKARAQEVNRRLASLVDVMLGNEEDFSACLGLEVPGVDEDFSALDSDAYVAMMQEAFVQFPNFRLAASTLRTVLSASRNGWSAIAYSPSTGGLKGIHFQDLEVLDRVGGGDSFASGLVFGLLAGRPLEEALNLGIAHGALAMTTPGDTSMATRAEVERLALGGGARIQR